MKDKKGVAFLKVDNGSDWNLHSLVNAVYFCRVFKDSKLDVLGIISYAAKYSAFNNIEHLWSPMSKKLSSVILRSVLDGVKMCLTNSLICQKLKCRKRKLRYKINVINIVKKAFFN